MVLQRAVEIVIRRILDLSDRPSVTPQPTNLNDLWDIVFTQEPAQEGFGHLGILVPLQENIEHEAVRIHGPPE